MFGLTSRQFFVLLTVWIGVYCNYVCYSVIAPFFPLEAKKKGLSAEEYSLVFASYSVAQLIFSFAAGRSLGKIGVKNVIVWGLAATGLSTIIFGGIERIQDKETFLSICLVIRFVEGAGFAAYFTSALSMIVETFPADPGYYVGLTESIVTLGMMMGPPIGSFLYEAGGFPAPFITFGVTLVTTSLVSTFSIPNGGHDYQKLTSSESTSTSSSEVISLRDYINVLKLPSAILAVLCTLLNVTSDIFLLITLSTHLQQFQVTNIQTGFIYLCLFLSYGISSPLSGKIADHSDFECLLQSFGSFLITIAFMLVGPALLFIKSNVTMVIIGLLLKGLGAGPLISCSYTSCLKAAKFYAGRTSDFKTYTLVSTIISFSIPLGNLIGGYSAGIMYEYLGMSDSCLIFMAIFSVLGVLCALNHFREKRIRESHRLYPEGHRRRDLMYKRLSDSFTRDDENSLIDHMMS